MTIYKQIPLAIWFYVNDYVYVKDIKVALEIY